MDSTKNMNLHELDVVAKEKEIEDNKNQLIPKSTANMDLLNRFTSINIIITTGKNKWKNIEQVKRNNSGICLIYLHRILNEDAEKIEVSYNDIVQHALLFSKKLESQKNRNEDYTKENGNGFYVHNTDSNIEHNCNHMIAFVWIDNESDHYIKDCQYLGNKNTKK